MPDSKLIPMISVLTLFAWGCSSSVNKPGTPPVRPVPESLNTSKEFHWYPTLLAHSSRYRVDDSSTVSITSDSTRKEVLLASSTIYSLALTQGKKLTVDLRLDSISTDSTNSMPSQMQPKVHATATLSARGQIVDLHSTTPISCQGGMDPRFVRLSELIILLPPNPVVIGNEWADTSTSIICHGRIALKQYVVRNYRLLSALSLQNRPVVQLQRTASVKTEGVPADSTNSIVTSGTGSSSTILFVDQDTGELLKSTGTSDLFLSVTTSRGIFPFQQHSKITVESN